MSHLDHEDDVPGQNGPKVARWETITQKNWDLNEGSDGLDVVLGQLEESNKRAK